MARKSIPIFECDGVTLKHRTTYLDAYSLIKSQTAVWLTPYKSVRLLDKRIVARGIGQFLDVWELRPSDGIPVWQMRTEVAG